MDLTWARILVQVTINRRLRIGRDGLIFNHLKLWIASARRNFKWVKIVHVYMYKSNIL